MEKTIRSLFVIALIAFAILGTLTVFLQVIGLITQNGALMVFADTQLFKYAVLGSTIAGFLSFIFPYMAGKKSENDF